MSVAKDEVELACMSLRCGSPINRTYIANMLEAQQAAIERLLQEQEVLRRVVRAGDFAQDSQYDEARKALSNFDKKEPA